MGTAMSSRMKAPLRSICPVIFVCVASSCDRRPSEAVRQGTDVPRSQPGTRVPSDVKSAKLSEPLAKRLKDMRVDPAFFAAVRPFVPSDCDDDFLISMLSGEPWPPNISPEEVAAAVQAKRQRLAAGAADVARRKVPIDSAKLRALVAAFDDKLTGNLFGYAATKSEEYLDLLRRSDDPRGAALAEYLARQISKDSLLEPLGALWKLPGVDTSLQLQYADLLLKAGRTREALDVIKSLPETGASSALFDGLASLRLRYLTEYAGKSPLEAATAILEMQASLPGIEGSAHTVTSSLVKQAKELAANGDAATAGNYAASALRVAQLLEDSNDLYVRLFSLMFQNRALKQIPEEQQQSYLSIEKAEWIRQNAEQKVELEGLRRFYMEHYDASNAGRSAVEYEQYSSLVSQIGQVEALRRLKAESEGRIGPDERLKD
jgi:hypothetical protein